MDKDSFDKETDDEVAIDFSKIKSGAKKFFKNLGGNEKKDDFQVDVNSFFKKYKHWLIPIALILVAIIVSSHFRMMPSTLPVTDDWAKNTVNDFYKQQITSQVNQQYPSLPQQNRDSLIDQELTKQFRDNKARIDQDIVTLSNQYKANFQDENGDTYLLAIDPYLWYSQARNVINHGHLGDKIIDGESYFSLRDGRLDKKSNLQLHPYIAAYLFKFLHFYYFYNFNNF